MAVEVLLAAGDIAEARRLVAEMAALVTGDGRGHQLRMEGRMALATGDHKKAIERLSAAITRWRDSGARREADFTRLDLARALVASGAREMAEAEIRAVLSSATERGALFEESRARSRLSELGVPSGPTESEVKKGLRSLGDEAALARSPLAGLRFLPTAPEERGANLRHALIGAIARLEKSITPIERDAGAVLRLYYIDRRGSWEKVAELIHMDVQTVYRRARDGMTMIARQMAEQDLAAAHHR
jgi:hypothetical protein